MTTTTKLPPPPVVPGKFILGNTLEMGKDSLTFVYNSYRTHGPVFQIKTIKGNFTVIAGPEIHELFKNKGDQKLSAKPPYEDFIEALMGTKKSIVTMEGQEHLRLRNIMGPAFRPSLMLNNRAKLIPIIKGYVQKQLGEEAIEVIPLFQRLVSEILALMLSGNQELDEAHDAIVRLFSASHKIHLLKTVPKFFKHLPSYQKHRKVVLQFMEDLNKKKKEEYNRGDTEEFDLMRLLYEGVKKYPELLSDEDVRSNIMTPFMAGLETATNTSSFVLYELFKNPDMLHAVKKEAANITNLEKEMGLKELKAQETLFCLQMEVLRLYPLASMFRRTVIEDFEFKGHLIKKGTDLLLASASTHKMEEFFPNPDKLDLDRHKAPRNEYRQKEFAPYGLGVHKCLGDRISETIVMLLIGILIDNFDLEMVPSDWTMKFKKLPPLAPSSEFKIKIRAKT